MKQYVIIGGSSGIGAALSKRLGHHSSVIATHLNSETQDLENVVWHHFDVMSPKYDWLPETIDGLVYCPGSINLKPFKRIKRDAFVEDFNFQVGGAIDVIQNCLPALKNSGNASIVLFSTVAVGHGFNFHTQVAASKGALEGLGKALAAELAPSIRVNLIAPSLTETPLSERMLNSETKIEQNANRHPLKRIGQPNDIAAMAEFLLGDDSSWVTGQVLNVDGGMSTLKV
jgi:NAD(P)-dependent dehydrogenase (short-subunit alcohol dehydrogenase family)